ncbi:MAG: beta-ketoacyl-ACP synthase II [Bdellovibrionales bacterium]
MAANIFVRPPKPQRRVVVTGMGLITPLGLNLAESWDGLVSGRSGIGPITQFDCSSYDTKIAGEIKGFNPDEYIPKKEQKKMDRFIHLAMAAAKMALADAQFEIKEQEKDRIGTLVGVGMGGLPYIETQNKILMERGPSRVTPFFIPSVITNMASGQISMAYGFKGPNYAISSACASGAHAIGEATGFIRDGICDVMVVGGMEAVVTPLAIAGFGAMRALSTRNEDPQAASRPWDRDRDGFVLSEGCGMLILEDYEYASQRGAKIYAEVCGFGASSDAYHMTSPSPGGVGAARSMSMCLQDAQVSPEKVDYINAHGTSTPAGDEIETEGIKKVFGDHSKKLWISSTKSMIGHTLGAAGAVESVIAIQALTTGVVPPTINLDNPSADCDLDYVPKTAREKKLSYVLNNSFGFGGTNCSLLFGRV